MIGVAGLTIWLWGTTGNEGIVTTGQATPELDDAGSSIAARADNLVRQIAPTPSGTVPSTTQQRLPALRVTEPAAVVSDSEVAEDPGARFKRKWQLSGVAHSEGTSVVLLTDRENHATHRINPDSAVDGWIVTDAGPNFAVFAQGDTNVRLGLTEDSAR